MLQLLKPEFRSNRNITSKLMLGLPFYGYKTEKGSTDAIIGSSFVEILKRIKPVIEWDDTNSEHVFKGPLPEDDLVIYYPTLQVNWNVTGHLN